MGFLDYKEEVSKEEALEKGWNNRWYTTGFHQGMLTVLYTLKALMVSKEQPKKLKDLEQLIKVFEENRHFLASQWQECEFDYEGFIRKNKITNSYEFFQPLSAKEGFKVLMIALESKNK